jgi:heterodisulfide reductase subunit B
MCISHVFDTYAKTSQGKIIHFDVVIHEQDQQKALNFAKEWLKSIGEEDATVTAENCYFCHSVEASTELSQQIKEQGYAIYKLEGCPK